MSQSLHILFIEDNVDYAFLTAEAMRGEMSLTYEIASTLAAGVERLARPGVDLTLLDLRLPDAVKCPLARIQEAAPAVPIIVLTGMGDPDLEDDAMLAGAQDAFCKTRVTIPELASAIRRAVIRYRVRTRFPRIQGVLDAARSVAQGLSETTPDGSGEK